MTDARIGDLIDVPPVRTVMRLEDGRAISEEVSSSFVFTPQTAAHLTVLADALASGKGQGYFLHGDFGSGKSHFLAALYAWVSGRASPAGLSAAPEGLRGVGQPGLRFLPVAVSLVRYRGAATLEEVILQAAEEELRSSCHEAALTGLPGSVEREQAFLAMLEAARAAGYGGIVLLVDELSEFLRSKPSSQALNDDARALQLLGELAGPQPLWIVAAVQESIERTGDVAQAILRKIKDRYPVRLTLSTTHIRSIISGRLVKRKPGADEAIHGIHELYRSLFPSFGASLRELLETYPVHPATIALLDGLGDLFSQHRGIVDFVHARVAGDERRGIPSILGRPAAELLGPDSIYEHFAPRLMEFSAFYAYPRHIVPHLDEVIDKVLAEEADRVLARRVVRMLVLYRIHPTATEPDCAHLVELAACSLDFRSLELSARFLAEAILDPVVAASSFLVRSSGPGGDPTRAVYAIATEEDPARVLGERVKRTASDLRDTDSRLLTDPLTALPESEAWPGRAAMERGVERQVTWNLSTRGALVRFADAEERVAATAQAGERVEQGGADFAVLFVLQQGAEAAAESAPPHVVRWELARPDAEKLGLLKEYLASRLVLAELKPSSPADAALIEPARQILARLEPAATQIALAAFYGGRYSDSRIRVDPAIRQLRRFDRLLESAGETLLAERYPKFASVAPRRFTPSARAYQQILDDFVLPGSLPLAEARSRSLAPAIDGLAVPLGLVEVRRGSYVYSPDARGHPLLAHLFGHLDPAAAVPLPELLRSLARGPYGLPRETSLFLLAALTAGGLVVVRRKGRSIPLEFLNLSAVESADEVGLGELIAESDRKALQEDCPFLFPAPSEGSFGLKQQREAWKEAVRFRASMESTLPGIAASIERLRGFASLSGLDLEEVESRVDALSRVREEIKVSYGAKEGLERFLAAWRESGLDAAGVEGVRGLARFLTRGVDEFIFTSHYARHQAVLDAASRSPELGGAHARLLALLENPTASVVPDGGEALRGAFAELRELYAERYEAAHAAANRRPERSLDRAGERALALLRSLAAVPGLDRAPGLVAYLERLDGRARSLCTRHVREELLRAPLCGCGFRPDQERQAELDESTGETLGGFLRTSVEILRSPAVLEAIAARSFALKDADAALSGRLVRLRDSLSAPLLSAAHLPDILDPGSCRELGEALSRKLQVRQKSLEELDVLLAGRRLEPARLRELFEQWLGDVGEGSFVSVEAAGARGPEAATASGESASWWRELRPELFTGAADAAERRRVEAVLEARFPVASLAPVLERLGSRELMELLETERFHQRLLERAWAILAGRALEGRGGAGALSSGDFRLAGSALPGASGAPEVGRRIQTLRRIVKDTGLDLPARLDLRISLEQVARDPWATEDLRASCRASLAAIEELASSWLETLQPVQAIRLAEAPLVLVVDAAPADLWCAVEGRLRGLLERAGGRHTISWRRLEAAAQTAGAMEALLGLAGDPVVELDSRGIPYRSLSGDEAGELLDLAGPLRAGTAAVIRIAVLDRRAHTGEASLLDLAEHLDGFLARRMEALLGACRSQGRPLVLTTDHGLSLARGRLVHGKGGPYERAIFRLEWAP